MATEQEIHQWLAGYPRNWDQLCQALMWQLAAQFGTVVSTPPSANSAYRTELAAGRIQNTTPPPGSFVYFDIGSDDHVGFVMDGGRVLMATSHLAEQWVDVDAGWNTIDAYVAATGAGVYGWSWQNGGNSVPFASSGGSDTAGGGGTTPISSTEEELMNYVKIQGKSGERRGGTYAVFGTGGGAYTAVFVGSGGPADLEPVTDDTAIAQLQQRISGLS